MDFVEKVAKDIKKLKIQGARSIAIAGMKTLKRVAAEDGFGNKFDRACRLLVTARPTAVAVYNAVKKVEKERTMKSINDLLYYFTNVSTLIAYKNHNLIKSNTTILTHCHSSVVVELLKTAKAKGKKFRVLVTETRPLYQGEKTARELAAVHIPVVYMDDSAPGHFIKDTDMLLLGVDAIRREGVVNKIGSYMLAVLAAENNVPVYFVGELLKLDKRKKIIIEERNPKEVIEPKKLRGVKIENPAFDITPWKYVSGVLTEKGLMSPKKILRMLK